MNLEVSNENLYNNADSFAMAFDAAWKDCNPGKNIDIDNRIEIKAIAKKHFVIEKQLQQLLNAIEA